jgi:predicted  nucleic acid-binding Zn-ribbon protein
MITDRDIEKMKAVFATKEDIAKLEKKLSRDIKNIHKDLIAHDQRFERIEEQLAGGSYLRDKPSTKKPS